MWGTRTILRAPRRPAVEPSLERAGAYLQFTILLTRARARVCVRALQDDNAVAFVWVTRLQCRCGSEEFARGPPPPPPSPGRLINAFGSWGTVAAAAAARCALSVQQRQAISGAGTDARQKLVRDRFCRSLYLPHALPLARSP